MPCHAAMTKEAASVPQDCAVEDVLALMKKKRLELVAVLGEGQRLEGVFSIPVLFRNALPVSVSMAGGGQIDIAVQAAPGIAKRLKKVDSLPVSEIMARDFAVVHPETPIWEGINLLVQSRAPLMVVEKETRKFLGLMNYQSALDELQRLKESEI